ncbi:MAG: phage tail tube protein [Bacteriovoracaceae bacterium]
MVNLVIKNESSVSVSQEATYGTYVAPVDGTSYLEVGDSINVPSSGREAIESNNLTSTVEGTASRLGKASVSGEIPMDLKAGSNEGDVAPCDVLLNSAMGGRTQFTTEVTTKTGHTVSQLEIEDADISKFTVNHPILVKEAGNFQIRIVTAIDSTGGAANITIFPDLEAIPADNVVIGKSTVYFLDSKLAKSFSQEFNLGGKLKHEFAGLQASSFSIADWTTGTTPKINFNFEGAEIATPTVAAPSYSPVFPTSEVPTILRAQAWINDKSVHYNELSLGLESNLGEAPSAAKKSGVLKKSIVKQLVSGKINPYMDGDNTDMFEMYNLNEDFSLFSYTFNPTATEGEFKEAVVLWIPQAKMTENPAEEVNGNMTDGVVFKAHRDLGNDTVFLGFM